MPTPDGQATTRPDALSRWAGAVRAHPVRAYFVITYVVSWSYWLLIHGLLDKDSYWWAAPGVFVPALVAIVVTEALGGRRGVRTFLRSWIRWRVPARWYVFALVALPALVVLSYVFLPDGTKGLERSPVIVGLTYLATFVVIVFVGGGQEEPGWRGFALPRLQQRFGPIRGSVLLGTLWGFWHLPLFVFIPNYDNAGYGAAEIATAFLVFVCGVTIGQIAVFDLVIQPHKWQRTACYAGTCFGEYGAGIRPDDTVCDVNILFGRFGDWRSDHDCHKGQARISEGIVGLVSG